MTARLTVKWNERVAIEWALKEDGMTAAALAKKIGMNPTKLSRIISGDQKNLPIDELKRIAKGQGRQLDYYTEPPIIQATPGRSWVPRPIDFYAAQRRLRTAA